ncbi:MAG TPA: GNAT family N-acetyltransferase [Vicinamibacterales bacterium]|nr:GNAT family N-acetyltransferase [Vicinamibacterales bacterium]
MDDAQVDAGGFPDTFSTARLRAERLAAGHLDEIHRMHCDPAVMAHLGGVKTEKQTAEYFDRNLRHWDQYGHGLWVLYERTGNEVIGRAVLRHLLVEDVDEIEVGYAFSPAFWGQGLATEVTAACIGYARDELRLKTIVAITAPANLASQRVLLKNGLVYDHETTIENVVWSLFRRHWEP